MGSNSSFSAAVRAATPSNTSSVVHATAPVEPGHQLSRLSSQDAAAFVRPTANVATKGVHQCATGSAVRSKYVHPPVSPGLPGLTAPPVPPQKDADGLAVGSTGKSTSAEASAIVSKISEPCPVRPVTAQQRRDHGCVYGQVNPTLVTVFLCALVLIGLGAVLAGPQSAVVVAIILAMLAGGACFYYIARFSAAAHAAARTLREAEASASRSSVS